ncbi:MAG: hypothetical protein ACFFA4_16860, partial [Promethearchaeota archaeon]
DAGDYLDRIRLIGWSAYDTNATIADFDHDTLNGTGTGEFTHDVSPDATVGGTYERVLIYLNVVATNAYDFDISYVQVEYYYT